MAQRVVLHIGLMKSGTSYLQRLLSANRDLLSDRGVLFPGRNWPAQVRAVSEVMQRKRVVAPPPPGSWRALVEDLEEWPGTGIISMEYLAPAAPRAIDAVVSSFPAGSVEVVVTARDLGRGVPAMWQESLKNGRSQPFEDYVADVAGSRNLGKRFWREQDVAATCARWREAVDLDRIVVVTVPPPGASSKELWTRFASALELQGGGVVEPDAANESLGASSAEVLRQLNTRLEDLPFGMYSRRVKQQLAKRVMARRRADEPALGFEPPPWLYERSGTMVDALRDSGVRVVGDLGDLEPRGVPGVQPQEVTIEQQLAAAIGAIEGVVRDSGRNRGDG